MFKQAADTDTKTSPPGLSKQLVDCCQGESVTVVSLDPSLSLGQRLRELGLIEGSQLVLLKQSDPLLILVKESRIALDPKTAKGIKVFCGCINDQPVS